MMTWFGRISGSTVQAHAYDHEWLLSPFLFEKKKTVHVTFKSGKQEKSIEVVSKLIYVIFYLFIV